RNVMRHPVLRVLFARFGEGGRLDVGPVDIERAKHLMAGFMDQRAFQEDALAVDEVLVVGDLRGVLRGVALQNLGTPFAVEVEIRLVVQAVDSAAQTAVGYHGYLVQGDTLETAV